MIIDLEQIGNDILRIQRQLEQNKISSPSKINFTPSIQNEIKDEMIREGTDDLQDEIRYIIKAYKILKKLGMCKTQYEFSQCFLNKTPYYYGMIKCSGRIPSIDCLSNLLRGISMLNDGEKYNHYLENLYEDGRKLITKRLIKYF